MGFAKPIEQIFIKLSRYIYVSKRYYTRRRQYVQENINARMPDGGYGCFNRNSESCTSLCSRAGVKGGDEQR